MCTRWISFVLEEACPATSCAVSSTTISRLSTFDLDRPLFWMVEIVWLIRSSATPNLTLFPPQTNLVNQLLVVQQLQAQEWDMDHDIVQGRPDLISISIVYRLSCITVPSSPRPSSSRPYQSTKRYPELAQALVGYRSSL